MALPDLLYRGTAKNLRGKPGVSPYILEFTDRYAIYDWGDMPEDLQGKAEAMAFLAWFFFDHLGNPASWQNTATFKGMEKSPRLARLADEGLPHHMIGLAGGDLRPLSLDREILSPSKHLLVKPLVYPDDAVRDDEAAERVLPFAVRFTFDGTPADKLAVAYISSDDGSVLSPTTAVAKGKLSAVELDELDHLAKLVALRLRATCKDIGADLAEGTLHFAVTGTAGAAPRDFMLVDALGPDDLKLYVGNVAMSQDVLQLGYRGSNWLTAMDKAKSMAAERGERDWKRICIEELKAHPPLLSPMVKEKAVMVYKSLAREFSQRHYGKAVFAKAWDVQRTAAMLSPRPEKASA